MAKHFLEKLDVLAKEKKIRVEIEDLPLLVLYHEENVYVLKDKCPHMRASLYKGTFEDGVVTCRKHGAQIDAKTGEVLRKAKIGFVHMPTKKATTYPAVIEDGKVFVKL